MAGGISLDFTMPDELSRKHDTMWRRVDFLEKGSNSEKAFQAACYWCRNRHLEPLFGLATMIIQNGFVVQTDITHEEFVRIIRRNLVDFLVKEWYFGQNQPTDADEFVRSRVAQLCADPDEVLGDDLERLVDSALYRCIGIEIRSKL